MINRSFLSKFLALLGGSVIAQLIPVLASPLLTRFYNPEQFGQFGMFMAVFAVLSVAATARYELAIPLPRSRVLAAQLVYLAFLAALIVALLIFIGTFAYRIISAHFLGIYWLFAPLLLFFGIYQATIYWHNRNDRFKLIAESRLVQNGGMTVGQLFLGQLTSFGLELGFVFGVIMAATYSCLRSSIFKAYSWNRAKTRILARQYNMLPKYNLIPAMLDALAHQIPLLVIFWYYSSEQAGHYFLAAKILTVPTTFLVGIMAQVYLNEMSVLCRNSKLEIVHYVKSKARLCFYVALPSCLLFSFLAPTFFPVIFGKGWELAGELSRFLVFSAAIRFIVAPLSSYFIAAKQMKLASLWQVLSFASVSIVSFVFVGARLELLVIAYVVSDILIYTVYYLLILYSMFKLVKPNLRERGSCAE